MEPYVRICDTTLRDGGQTPGGCIDVEDKVRTVKALEAFGVDTVETGIPAPPPGDVEAVVTVARAVRGCNVMRLVLDVSAVQRERGLGFARSRVIRAIETAVACARRSAAQVHFTLESVANADPIFVRQCAEIAVDAGATHVNITDTAGGAGSETFRVLVHDMAVFLEGRAGVSAHAACAPDPAAATV